MSHALKLPINIPLISVHGSKKRAYRLLELIQKKYGEREERLALGCQLVASFVGFGSKDEWTPIKVLKMCKAEEKININIDDSYRFMSLFKLASIEELFT